jgi:hypothetical protein
MDDEGEMSAITPAMRVGAWEILSVDPSGKRAVVSCPCQNTHVSSTEALLNGTATCASIPQRAGKRRRDLKDWRPGDRT